jgi:hypothetical protein
MKTSELTGAALDWAVALIEYPEWKEQGYLEVFPHDLSFDDGTTFAPSTNWAQGGPIIERDGIGLDQYADYPRWQAFTPAPEQPSGQAVCNGPTPLIAAMRCYVASKLGDEIEIPEEDPETESGEDLAQFYGPSVRI